MPTKDAIRNAQQPLVRAPGWPSAHDVCQGLSFVSRSVDCGQDDEGSRRRAADPRLAMQEEAGLARGPGTPHALGEFCQGLDVLDIGSYPARIRALGAGNVIEAEEEPMRYGSEAFDGTQSGRILDADEVREWMRPADCEFSASTVQYRDLNAHR